MKKIELTSVHWWLVGGCGALILIGGTVAVLLFGIYYRQWDGSIARTFAKTFGLAAARVGREEVSYGDYLALVESQKRFLAGPAARAAGYPQTPPKEALSQMLDIAMRITLVEQMAREREVVVTALDVERAYDEWIRVKVPSSTKQELEAYLQNGYGMDEKQFKTTIFRPLFIEDILRQKRLNETGNATAFEAELEERLKKEDVVKYLRF